MAACCSLRRAGHWQGGLHLAPLNHSDSPNWPPFRPPRMYPAPLLPLDGGVLYICGVPGTGKTACMMEVLAAARHKAKAAGTQFVSLNCLQLPTPQHVYSKLWERLSGQRLGTARWGGVPLYYVLQLCCLLCGMSVVATKLGAARQQRWPLGVGLCRAPEETGYCWGPAEMGCYWKGNVSFYEHSHARQDAAVSAVLSALLWAPWAEYESSATFLLDAAMGGGAVTQRDSNTSLFADGQQIVKWSACGQGMVNTWLRYGQHMVTIRSTHGPQMCSRRPAGPMRLCIVVPTYAAVRPFLPAVLQGAGLAAVCVWLGAATVQHAHRAGRDRHAHDPGPGGEAHALVDFDVDVDVELCVFHWVLPAQGWCTVSSCVASLVLPVSRPVVLLFSAC